jgi:2'-5' RNA ligase
MKLYEIAQKVKPDGTYVAATMDKDSLNKIKTLQKELNIPNEISRSKMHTTIIYSKKYNPNVKADQSNYPMEAKAKELTVFKQRNDKNALVLKLECQGLEDRHNYLMTEYNLTYDFPQYHPHITLSYDCGDFNPSNYKGELPSVTFVSEYVEDLIMNWKEGKK